MLFIIGLVIVFLMFPDQIAVNIEVLVYQLHLLPYCKNFNLEIFLLIMMETVTLAKLSEQMYKEGYDARAFTAQHLPVLVYEVIVRTFWFFKQHFYYGKSVKESLPIGNNPDLQRMLFISATSFTAIDTGHAAIKSGFAEPITFFMTLNYPGLINFGFKTLQSTRYQIKHIQKLTKFDADIQAEWDRLILRDM